MQYGNGIEEENRRYQNPDTEIDFCFIIPPFLFYGRSGGLFMVWIAG